MCALREAPRPWQRWTGEPRLGSQEVLVWRALAIDDEPGLARLWNLLDERERQRASGLRSASQRAEFITAHAMLRHLLGAFSGGSPGALEFRTNAYGRPFLVNGRAAVHFSLSHSAGMILVALAEVQEIGVDVERVHDMPDYLAVAKQFFADEEADEIEASGTLRAFFRCWTRKEAVVKATGQGLSLSLREFSVSAGESEPARMTACAWDPAETAHWTLLDCDPAEEFAAAVAVRLRSPVIRWLDWDLGCVGALLR